MDNSSFPSFFFLSWLFAFGIFFLEPDGIGSLFSRHFPDHPVRLLIGSGLILLALALFVFPSFGSLLFVSELPSAALLGMMLIPVAVLVVRELTKYTERKKHDENTPDL